MMVHKFAGDGQWHRGMVGYDFTRNSKVKWLHVAARMVGTERSRGYCLELICADFLAGRTEESTPEEIRLVIHRLLALLPPDYQTRMTRQSDTTELEPSRRC